MPVSSAETRARWRKRKRESRKSKYLQQQQAQHNQDDEAVSEDEDEEDQQQQDVDEENPPRGGGGANSTNHSSSPGDRGAEEVVLDSAARISDFPSAVRREVSRPHLTVNAIVQMERAGRNGESPGGSGKSGVVLENVSHGQLLALSMVPRDSPALLGSDESGSGSHVITPPRIMEGKGVVKRLGSAGRVHVVPVHSEWFSPSAVHRLERQVVPHFFSGKSRNHTPEKYMECRNCIVAKYMENPDKRLTVADCQGLIYGIDIDDISRIVRFLDHWGIINYCALPARSDQGKDGTYLREDSNGDLVVPSAALKSIDSLIQFDRPRCRLKGKEVYPGLMSQQDEESDFDCTIREQLSGNRCNFCCRPIPLVYYQSQKEVDVLLCLECFNEGQFVAGHSSLDFVKVNSMKDYGDLDGESWTDQETLLLLEGMQLYNENWNEIADHVGTKSKAQCILHFVRLPVDGTPLENIDVPGTSVCPSFSRGDSHVRSHSNANGHLSGSSLQDSEFESKFPFANCGNPVMALVAFLASAVGPRVAAACAHASLAELSKEDSNGSRTHMEGMERSPHGEIAYSSLQKEEKLGGQSPWNQQHVDATALTAEKVKVAAKVGLAAAATKAKLFADHEEREIQRLSANIINHQLKRLELKLKQFAEVETLLMRECEQMERNRQRIMQERNLVMSGQFGSGVPRPVGIPGASSTMVNNNTGSSRQQAASGSPQPFISGYGNNQPPIHPHMALMSQQSAYGLGPRLPLSALHPTPSAPNVMFNAAANPQPTISHPMLRPLSGTRSGLG